VLLVMAAGALLAAQGPIFAPSASDAGGAAPGLALRDVARVVCLLAGRARGEARSGPEAAVVAARGS